MGPSQDVWGSQEADGVAELKSLKVSSNHAALHG
jgi:hypothetical protein